MSPADDRKLVKVVECHHVLWDNRMKEFRNKRLTEHGWKSVAELLDREVNDVMYRWANLRKQYSRRITRMRQKEGSPEKPWHLMSLLAFLRPCITPRKWTHSSTHNNSSTSTQEISSSSQSDDCRESSPLVVRINPVEPLRNSLFYSIPEKKPVPRNSALQRRPLRKLAPKPAPTFNLPSKKKTTNELSGHQEQFNNPSPAPSPKIRTPDPNVHKLSSTPKVLCVRVKPPQTAIRSVPLKAKKRKTSSEQGLSSFAKNANASSETEKKHKSFADKTSSVTKSSNVSSETEKRPKISARKPLSSVIKSINASLETDRKLKTFAENTLSVPKSTNASMETEKKLNTFAENTLYVPKSTNASLETEQKLKTFAENNLSVAKCISVCSEVHGHKGYDSDEHFLLSLASDFRKMDPRQKYECKIKMIGMVCEQYVRN